jgi:hypothetical protein
MDGYRDIFRRGGIADVGIAEALLIRQVGEHRIEDTAAITLTYPYMNAYWADKCADLSKIIILAYGAGLRSRVRGW